MSRSKYEKIVSIYQIAIEKGDGLLHGTPWPWLLLQVEEGIKKYSSIKYEFHNVYAYMKRLILKGKRREVEELYNYILSLLADNPCSFTITDVRNGVER